MEVGLAIGGRVASTVISKMINELIEYAKDQKKMQQGLKDELARLEKVLPKINEVVNTVDQGLIIEENQPLKNWLWQLRDAVDQADDVMDEIKYNYEKERVEAEENKVNKAITNFKTFFLRAVDKDPFLKRLTEAVKAIDEVAADVTYFYMLVKDLVKDQKKMIKLAIKSRESSSVLDVEPIHVFGMEKEKEDIIKKLLNPHCKSKGINFEVLPIIGVGGVGKTTLAKLVYNDPTVQNHFELRMWVCISNNFDVVFLTKKLYESAFGQRADYDSFDKVQSELESKLQSKRFLVVFDDAWNDNDKPGWEKLVAPLKNGKSGSMILLTTRLKVVAELIGSNLMDSIILKGLNEHGMWDLFKVHAFGSKDPNHMSLVEIGRSIVKKLKGSPLAAKTIGGILCSDLSDEHWTGVLESELWSLKQGKNDIMPALRLTYQYLPSHLKSCFSFCSIFPQDHIFHKHDLVNIWIALGMVPAQSINGIERLEDVGSKYFNDMVNRSIFTHYSPFGLSHQCVEFVMHDLIHDLSILVSQGECLRTRSDELESIPNTIRHLLVHIDGPFNISHLKNLRTLILHFHGSHNPKHGSLVTEMLKGIRSLRLLMLVGHNSEFPESVSKLLHLRYLRVCSSKIIAYPKSVSRLYLLETLELLETKGYNDFGIIQLKLTNLRHLTAPKWWFYGISGIGRLTSLQELSFSVGKDNGIKISELSDMRELRSLTVDKIENVESIEEVIQANLRNKVNLKQLRLSWTQTTQIVNKHANDVVLDHLEPHPGLKEFTISFYEGIGRPPIWFRTQALSKLIRLVIDHCNFERIPSLEELPVLKYIYFTDMNAIKGIIHECNQSSLVDAFPSLEELSLRKMTSIEVWYLAKQPNKWMRCLRKLSIVDCPKLQYLPDVPIGVEELNFEGLALNTLPNFWNDQSSQSGSLPALVDLSIRDCLNLLSLTQGLLQNPEIFGALEKLTIYFCINLMYLPPGGFNKFKSLKELNILFSGNILAQEECFLPSDLQSLAICSSRHLDSTLSKALESLNSLIKLDLSDCENITSLPPKEVFSRWKTLKRLTLENCRVLACLESLHGLSSIEYLSVRGCPELSRAIPSPLTLQEDETERIEEGTTQTSERNDEFNKGFSAYSRRAITLFQSLFTLFYLVLRMFMLKFRRSITAEPQPPSPSSTVETDQTSAMEKPMLSVDELDIDDPLLLSIEPIRSTLSSVRKLTISDCSKLQSLPELPPFLQELYIKNCCRQLQRRCKKSGPDWPKLSQIPKVIIEDNMLKHLTIDEEYDVIVLGTGLKECILRGLLHFDGLKILQMDRKDYFGGESTSLNLIQIMKANGTLLRFFFDFFKHQHFKTVDGSYVFNKGKVHKVTATNRKVPRSPLIGLFKKQNARKFITYVQNYDESDMNTHECLDLTRVTTKELMSKYGLDDNTIDFIGHALALHRGDFYLDRPALDTVKRMQLYAESHSSLGGSEYYIYPLDGLGNVLQSFQFLSAVDGGTECKVEFDMEGKACGVTWAGETTKCKKVVCDPSYLPNKVRKVGKVARAIAIMSHPIPNTDEGHLVHILLPQKQLGRKSDMYLFCCSYLNRVVPQGKFIAFVSCEAETDNPELELKPGVDLLGPVDEIFFETCDRYEPVNDPTQDNCFISSSYDATTHFESTEMEVLSMYTLITGKPLDLTVDLKKFRMMNQKTTNRS